MKITIVSDTHGKYQQLLNIAAANKDSDLFIHLGDGASDTLRVENHNFITVKGNCDYGDFNTETVLEVAGKRVFITHGHNYYVKSGLGELTRRARELNSDIALYGHTHRADIAKDGNMYIMNPGSVYDNNSYGIIEISDSGEIKTEVLQL
jgi:hypothetical protein